MKKAQEAQQAGAELQEKGKDVSKLLSAFGGFNAVRGFMPDADNMNPTRKAAKDVFLKDNCSTKKASRALPATLTPARKKKRNIPTC